MDVISNISEAAAAPSSAPVQSSAAAKFPALERMSPITLGEMDSIKLMNRVDTKYVTTERMLALVLDRAAADGYRVLVTQTGRMCPYSTLYYDTPDLAMYTAHLNGVLRRRKVRTRTYLSSGQTFLEVKRKDNHGRTRKKRMEIPVGAMEDFANVPDADAFLRKRSGYGVEELQPRLYTIFRRITLVNPAMTERLTIDTALEFVNLATGEKAGLGDAVIIELKQDGLCPSPMKDILLDLRVKPFRVSKYCVGTVMTDPDVRKARFKMKVRYIEKITGCPLQGGMRRN